MSAREMAALEAHITGYDLPEKVKIFRQWSAQIGFQQAVSLWEGEWHSHKLLQLNLG